MRRTHPTPRLSRRCLRAGLALSLALAGQAVLLPHSSATTTLTVSTTADTSPGDGACGDAGITTAPSPLSLREATCLANNIGGDTTISVPAGTYTLTEGELRLGDEPDQDHHRRRSRPGQHRRSTRAVRAGCWNSTST